LLKSSCPRAICARRGFKWFVHASNRSNRPDTLVIVEHHPDVIANADWVVELGPEAGEHGGTIVFEGEAAALKKKKTATGLALRADPPANATLNSRADL
jgi:excinuclease ABC subunit A